MNFIEEVLCVKKENEMKYLIVYYECPEGPDGREPAEEYTKMVDCENDEAAKKEASRFRNARLYKEIPLK